MEHLIHMMVHPHGWWFLADFGAITTLLAVVDLIFGANAMNFVADVISDLEWDFDWFE